MPRAFIKLLELARLFRSRNDFLVGSNGFLVSRWRRLMRSISYVARRHGLSPSFSTRAPQTFGRTYRCPRADRALQRENSMRSML
jgi:hypothetical protein